MTQNDYIAEYVRERCPQILGIDFAFWKIGKQINNTVKSISNTFNQLSDEQKKIILSNEYEIEESE